MKTANQILAAASGAEALLSLMVMPCPDCQGGPLTLREASVSPERPRGFILETACRACGAVSPLAFSLPEEASAVTLFLSVSDLARSIESHPRVLNPTQRPSRLLDVADWLMLHGLIADEARLLLEGAVSPPDRAAARRHQMLAGLCLDEALRFYEDGNELPPMTALFTDRGRQQFRQRPEWFARTHILELRSTLPQPKQVQRRS